MAIHDISVPIKPGMHIYRNNPGYSRSLYQAIADGAEANVSELDLGAHTGTHVDGPAHFYDGGPGTEVLDLDAMIGPCLIVEIPDRGLDPIDADALEAAGAPAGTERLILKTTNSELWNRAEFTHDFIRLDKSGAEWVLDRGIRLIGIDYLSIGDGDAHRALLAKPIVALEGLDLRETAPGPYELICLPMHLADGSDGAPSRVVLRDL
jgi:arylformamidase